MNKTIKQAERYEAPDLKGIMVYVQRGILTGSTPEEGVETPDFTKKSWEEWD